MGPPLSEVSCVVPVSVCMCSRYSMVKTTVQTPWDSICYCVVVTIGKLNQFLVISKQELKCNSVSRIVVIETSQHSSSVSVWKMPLWSRWERQTVEARMPLNIPACWTAQVFSTWPGMLPPLNVLCGFTLSKDALLAFSEIEITGSSEAMVARVAVTFFTLWNRCKRHWAHMEVMCHLVLPDFVLRAMIAWKPATAVKHLSVTPV